MQPAGIDALLRFFFRPQGRITRIEYFLGFGFILSIDLAALSFLWPRTDLAGGALMLTMILGLPLTIAQFVLVAKRCHDIGLPGTFMLLLFVPVLGLVWLIFLALMPGSSGPNAYGPAPAFSSD